jgi:hypothetical protein
VAELFAGTLEAARSGHDERVVALVGELSERSPELVTRTRDGHLAPGPQTLAALGPGDLVPCFVKLGATEPSKARALDAVARALDASGLESHVETHVLRRATVSLYVAGHVELSACIGRWKLDRPELELAARERCIEELVEYAERADERAQAALPGGAGAPFPYAERLADTTRRLAAQHGEQERPALAGWERVAELCARSGRRALFFDPKPANFLVPQATLAGGPLPTRLYKVDVDWMLASAPLAHQAVVAAFSDPLEHGPGRSVATFDSLRGAVVRALPGAELDEPQLDALIVYHLFRNFVSKLRRGAPAAQPLGALLGVAMSRSPELVPAAVAKRLRQSAEALA